MAKQKSKKWRIILFIFGGLFFTSSFYAFTDSILLGIFMLLSAATFIVIPVISIVRDKKTRANVLAEPPAPAAPAPNNEPVDNPPASAFSFDDSEGSLPLERMVYTGKALDVLPDDYVCIDVETTGLVAESDRITEIAAARVQNGIVVERFSSLVHSPKPIPPFVSEKTGITNEMIQNAPLEKDILQTLFSFIGDAPLVGYNVTFDVKFLFAASLRASLPFSNDFFDCMRAARDLLSNVSRYRLSDVAEALSVPQPDAHRALADVLTTVACAEKLRPLALAARQRTEHEAQRQKILREYDFSKLKVDYKNLAPTVNSFDTNNPLFGKRVVFTGDLIRMTRQEACQLVVNLGGTAAASVTKKTAYLVVGDGPASPYVDGNGQSSKMRQADEWCQKGSSIQTISESDFFKIIDSNEVHL